MTRDIILAIDNGTQSVRALLFDLRGNLLTKSRLLAEPYRSPARQIVLFIGQVPQQGFLPAV